MTVKYYMEKYLNSVDDINSNDIEVFMAVIALIENNKLKPSRFKDMYEDLGMFHSLGIFEVEDLFEFLNNDSKNINGDILKKLVTESLERMRKTLCAVDTTRIAKLFDNGYEMGFIDDNLLSLEITDYRQSNVIGKEFQLLDLPLIYKVAKSYSALDDGNEKTAIIYFEGVYGIDWSDYE